jgi:hypothetical protein
MYKQRNETLVALFRILLLFEGVVAIISIFAFYRRGGATASFLELSAVEFLISYTITVALTYLLLRFFSRALAKQEVSADPIRRTGRKIEITEDCWVKAAKEFATPERHEALWAQVYSEADGDEGKAKARYIKARALRLQESLDNSEASSYGGVREIPQPASKSRLMSNISTISIGLVIIGLGGVYFVSQNNASSLYPKSPPEVVPHPVISSVEIMKRFRGLNDWLAKAKFIQSLLQSGQLSLKNATPVPFENHPLNDTYTTANIEHNQQWWIESDGTAIIFLYNMGYDSLNSIRLAIDSSNCKPENGRKTVVLDYKLTPSLAQYDMGAYLLERLVQHPDIIAAGGRPN